MLWNENKLCPDQGRIWILSYQKCGFNALSTSKDAIIKDKRYILYT
jgi:hypothetical protein